MQYKGSTLAFVQKAPYHWGEMKPHPAPQVPGNTEAERMDNAVRKLFTVPKEDYLKEEARLKRIRDRKRLAKK
jgi:hypothetical protein